MKHVIRLSLPAIILLVAVTLRAADPATNQSPAELRKLAKPRNQEALKALHSNPPRWDEFEKAARALVRDFGTNGNGYYDLMMLCEHYDGDKANPKRARELALEIANDPNAASFGPWAKGFIKRLDQLNKPLQMEFKAMDGRNVDLSKMTGKVVLVEFWGIHCAPCAAALPWIKSNLERHQAQGFEVIGINCDDARNDDAADVEKYLKKQHVTWPQFHDGRRQVENKYAQEFGIDGIPHMLLIDKKGVLRFDNLWKKEDFEKKLEKLLTE